MSDQEGGKISPTPDISLLILNKAFLKNTRNHNKKAMMTGLINLTEIQTQKLKTQIENYYTQTLNQTDITTSIIGKEIIVHFNSMNAESTYDFYKFQTLQDLQTEMTTDILFVFLHRDVVLKTEAIKDKVFIAYELGKIRHHWNGVCRGEEDVIKYLIVDGKKYNLDVLKIIQRNLELSKTSRVRGFQDNIKEDFQLPINQIAIVGLELQLDDIDSKE